MYGKKRIVLRKANRRGHQMVTQMGSDGPHGSYNDLGVWYLKDGKYYADLKSDDQEYQLLMVVDLAVKAFGGVNSKAELRNAIAARRGF
jgi:hypothetical protein